MTPLRGRAARIRELDGARDGRALRAFLDARDAERLAALPAAVADGDADVLVAEKGGAAVGWVVVHLEPRGDQGWAPGGGTLAYQGGDDVYVENLEIRADLRGAGLGARLLEAALARARARGRRRAWLHVRASNARAVAFYRREGWTHRETLHPAWAGEALYVYGRDLDGPG